MTYILFRDGDHISGGAAGEAGREVGTRGGLELRLDGRADVDQPITIRLADTDDQRSSARMLINRRYAWRGYGDSHQIPASPRHTTFTATMDEQVVGTITLAVDSPAGLAADRLFHDELNTFRRVPGAEICELTKFAFDMNGSSKPALAALFHIVLMYGQRQYRCTDLFIEVNPRHVRFYEAMLGFKRIGTLKMNESVAAPSQLMCIKVSEIRRQIDELAGAGDTNSRSLYPFFFSEKEERGLSARLFGHAENGTMNGEAAKPVHPAPVGSIPYRVPAVITN